MQPFAALERFFERLFERPSARIFGTRLQPVQLLRRLERELEVARVPAADGSVVPDLFTIRIHPSDFEALAAGEPGLPVELADGALRFARAHHYRVRRRPRVDVIADPAVEPGDTRIVTAFAGASDDDDGIRRVAVPTASDAMPPGAPGEATTTYHRPSVLGPIARLRILEPTGGDRALVVDGGLLTIGRAPDNALVLGDRRASRYHARLQARQGTLVLVDLGSLNGTIVNGVPVQEVALGVGDEIRIGDTRLLLEPLAP
jgi:hypothetical protein